MSLLRSARPAYRVATRIPASRGISVSAPRRADHQEQKVDEDVYTHETFFNSTWIGAIGLTAAIVAIAPFLPSPVEGSVSSATSNDALEKEAQDPKTPWLTRYIASNMVGKDAEWKERSERHLGLVADEARGKLVIQEAQQPIMRRLHFPAQFENASPNCIPVGSQCDLSDLKVKTDADDGNAP